MERKKYQYLEIISIIIVAGLGSLFVALGMEWFNDLIKPSQWIPNWIIPVVWTIIYLAFAIILWIWLDKVYLSAKTTALLITNGLLNLLWCLVFFTLQLTFLGQIIIVINLIMGFLLLKDIFKYNCTYGLILMIYPIWLSLATGLNTALWILN